MVNENNLINKKPVEEVVELKEVNWWEKYEVKKSPLSKSAQGLVNKKYGSDYQSIRLSSEDIALMRMYGPGFWDEFGGPVLKKVGAVALATTYFTPLGAVTGPLTIAGVAGGYAVEKIAEANGDDDVKEVAKFIKGMSFDAAVDGLSGGTLNSGAPLVAKATKKVCQGISLYNDVEDMARGQYIPNMPGPSQRGDIVNTVIKYGL